MSKKVSDAVIRRLPLYYRQLNQLEATGKESISSKELGNLLGLTASQIRQDFNHFGGFGHQGYGYNIAELRSAMAAILGLDRIWNIIIIGAGNMGSALAGYPFFRSGSYKVLALFDSDPALVGTFIHGLPVYDIKEVAAYIDENDVAIAALTVPAPAVDSVVSQLENSRLQAIWNFAPVKIKTSKSMVESIYLGDSLLALTFMLAAQPENRSNEDSNNL
jgi:redox-sensing transcriptional repressor